MQLKTPDGLTLHAAVAVPYAPRLIHQGVPRVGFALFKLIDCGSPGKDGPAHVGDGGGGGQREARSEAGWMDLGEGAKKEDWGLYG